MLIQFPFSSEMIKWKRKKIKWVNITFNHHIIVGQANANKTEKNGYGYHDWDLDKSQILNTIINNHSSICSTKFREMPQLNKCTANTTFFDFQRGDDEND